MGDEVVDSNRPASPYARARDWGRKWFQPAGVFLIGFFFFLVLAVAALGGAIFSDVLVAGPDLVIGTPAEDPSAVGITRITPTKLDSDSLRVGWTVGSVAILLGISFGSLTAAQAGVREKQEPLFGSAASSFLSARFTAAILLVLVGGFIRFLLEGRIATYLNIERIESIEDDYDLWVFDVPYLAIILGAHLIAAVWGRGKQLHDQNQDII